MIAAAAVVLNVRFYVHESLGRFFKVKKGLFANQELYRPEAAPPILGGSTGETLAPAPSLRPPLLLALSKETGE